MILGMTIEDRILDRLLAGEQPKTIYTALSISREWYYKKIKTLEETGRLSRIDELPPGSTVELCPTAETVDMFDDMLAGMKQHVVSRIRIALARYGWMTPPNPDDRYNRSQWSMHAVRRVDFQHHEDTYDLPGYTINYMVCGFLVPRVDNQPWYRAMPNRRVIYVERDLAEVGHVETWSWIAERDRVISPTNVERCAPIAAISSNQELKALSLASAFVLETRTLLD